MKVSAKTWDQSANIHSYHGVLLFTLRAGCRDRDVAETAAGLWRERSETAFVAAFPMLGLRVNWMEPVGWI